MPKVYEITEVLNELAPKELKEDWDNVGLLVGDSSQEIKRIFICLDITTAIVQEAVEFGADLIVSHHPLIFKPLKNVVESDIVGGIIRTLVRNNISLFSMHTNFDNADGGMNDLLADKLGLEQVRHFTDNECKDGEGNPLDNIGRVGILDAPIDMEDFVSVVKQTLGCRSIRYVGEPDDAVQTVALCSGAGAFGIYTAYRADADVYVTADIKHHDAQLASELGVNLIDAGHFETENIFCDYIERYLHSEFSDITTAQSEATSYFK